MTNRHGMHGSEGVGSGKLAPPQPHAAFAEFEKSLQKNQFEFIEQNIGSYELFERLVGFQNAIHNLVSKKHGESGSALKHQHISDELFTELNLAKLLRQNIRYVFSAWRVLEHNTIYASGSLIRSVVESVPKSFYLMKHPDTVKKFMLDEVYMIYRSKNPPASDKCLIPEFLKSERLWQILRGDQITPEEFIEFRKEHKNCKIREKIYDDKTRQLQREFLVPLNAGAHATAIRLHTIRPKPELSRSLAKIITDLSFLNLFLTANSQHRVLSDAGLTQDVERFIGQAWQDLGGLDPVTRMYPDKPEYLESLKIKPPRFGGRAGR